MEKQEERKSPKFQSRLIRLVFCVQSGSPGFEGRKKGRSRRPVFSAGAGDSVCFFRAQTGLALKALLLLLALLEKGEKHVEAQKSQKRKNRVDARMTHWSTQMARSSRAALWRDFPSSAQKQPRLNAKIRKRVVAGEPQIALRGPKMKAERPFVARSRKNREKGR